MNLRQIKAFQTTAYIGLNVISVLNTDQKPRPVAGKRVSDNEIHGKFGNLEGLTFDIKTHIRYIMKWWEMITIIPGKITM